MKITCPGCPEELEEEDLRGQMEHMVRCHPEIIAKRRADAARFDGWEQD